MSFGNEIIGGLLIGIGSALPLILDGRIAGISGYASAGLRPTSHEGRTALFFVLGLVGGGFLWILLGHPMPELSGGHLALWGAAGLLVGFGSRLAGGCTSGHGVCGLGRLSPRSLVSVLVFMSVAILIQFIVGKAL